MAVAERLAHRALPGPAGLGLRWHDPRPTAVALAIAQGAHPKASRPASVTAASR